MPGPVTVTFSSLNGECVAKATYTYHERKNSTTLQIKRALDEIEECVKRLRSEPDSCDESEELAKENFHESGNIFYTVWTNNRLKNFIAGNN